MNTPKGWKLVPVEPTYQMAEAIGAKWESGFLAKYKAMLDTAPSFQGLAYEPSPMISEKLRSGKDGFFDEDIFPRAKDCTDEAILDGIRKLITG